jgi:hypothetical protein
MQTSFAGCDFIHFFKITICRERPLCRSAVVAQFFNLYPLKNKTNELADNIRPYEQWLVKITFHIN